MEQNIKVAIVIPWRAQPDRRYAFDVVKQWYKNNLPDAKIILADDGKRHFCLSGCRNIGVKNAEESGADIVVINDADTLPEINPLLESIDAAFKDNYVHLPYTKYCSLRSQGTREFRNGKSLNQCDAFIVDGACSGVYVTSPKTWWSHYGQDERFRGWGFEDAAWYTAHKIILGKDPVRHEGSVYSMHHKSATKKGPLYEANAQLCATYFSKSDKESMKELASQGLFLS
jgi:hypothetical protein